MNTYKLYIKCETKSLNDLYKNKLLKKDNYQTDSGFDLYCPDNLEIECGNKLLIDLKIKCKMVKIIDTQEIPSAYYLYPRSSIGTKTPLSMANSVGIIDMDYRGNIMGCVKYNITQEDLEKIIHVHCFNSTSTSEPLNYIYKDFKYQIAENSRLFQICAPTLEPFKVELVNNLDKYMRIGR